MFSRAISASIASGLTLPLLIAELLRSKRKYSIQPLAPAARADRGFGEGCESGAVDELEIRQVHRDGGSRFLTHQQRRVQRVSSREIQLTGQAKRNRIGAHGFVLAAEQAGLERLAERNST